VKQMLIIIALTLYFLHERSFFVTIILKTLNITISKQLLCTFTVNPGFLVVRQDVYKSTYAPRAAQHHTMQCHKAALVSYSILLA
jgi:hypothetical protein